MPQNNQPTPEAQSKGNSVHRCDDAQLQQQAQEPTDADGPGQVRGARHAQLSGQAAKTTRVHFHQQILQEALREANL